LYPVHCAGQSYNEFIASMHLPGQLAAVDPIVASFCGGAVGVLTTLMVVEANNADQQAKRRCFYCQASICSRVDPGCDWIWGGFEGSCRSGSAVVQPTSIKQRRLLPGVLRGPG